MNFKDCEQVYRQLIKKNNIKNPPTLFYAYNNVPDAYTDGTQIVITSGMVKILSNRQELAHMLAHELSHINSRYNHSNHLNEFNADKDGAYMAKKAGYNPCVGKKWMLKFMHPTTSSHPSSIDRYNRLRCK